MTMPLQPSDLDNLVQLYESGLSSTQVARKLGVSITTVCEHLRRRGVVSRGLFAQVDTREIARRYAAGESRHSLMKRFGVGEKVIYRALAENGVERRPRRRPASADRVAEMFLSGIGVAKIAKSLGTCVPAIVEALAERGLEPRGRSEQQRARMQRASPTERKLLASAANKAMRGRARTFDEKCKMAATFEARQNRRSSKAENRLAEMLRARGLAPTRQKAIGPYNCDLAIPGVAVEVLGGKWHWHGDHAARAEERTRYILNAGWHLLMIAVDRSSPLTAAVADYVVAYAKGARRNPTAPREYRVIWRAGKFSTAGSADDEKITLEPPFRSRRNPATGRYETVAR